MKTLSPTNILNSLVLPIVLLMVLTALLFNNNVIGSMTISVIIFVFYAILLGWIYAALIRTYDLYYDSEHLYLRGAVRKIKLPLSSISRIQLTHSRVRILGILSYQYKIEFDGSISEDNQKFWVVDGSKKLDEFVGTVQKVNKFLIVRHFTS
jgi:hypothetical protein